MHSSLLSLDQYSHGQGVQSAAPVKNEDKSVLFVNVTFVENKIMIKLTMNFKA